MKELLTANYFKIKGNWPMPWYIIVQKQHYINLCRT